MKWKGILKAVWGGAKVIAPPVAQALGVPLVGTVMNAIIAAENRGGSGPEKFAAALDALAVSAPLLIDQLERQFGVDVPEDAAAAYTRALVQAHVDLMNACGMLPRGAK